MKRMSAKEARDNFSDVLGTVYYSKEPVIVQKRGRDFAVVISPEDYKRLLKEREKRFSVLDRIPRVDVEPDEAEELVAQEIADLRREKALGRQ